METFKLDLSGLLYPRAKPHVSLEFSKPKTPQLISLKFAIESDGPLLSDYLARKLNPLQLNIIGFKDVPFKSDPKFKPIFA